MTTLTLHAPTDLVAVTWIRSIQTLTADVVATQLPSDETTWASGGAVVVPTGVGGSPHMYMPVRRPVLQVECWATNPNSDKLPWNKANQLAEQIIAATYDRVHFGRALNLSANGVQYPVTRALSAQALNEPRRVWSDTGDYAGFTFDLVLHWVAAGEVYPLMADENEVEVHVKFFEHPIKVLEDEAENLRREGLLRDEPPAATAPEPKTAKEPSK